MRYLHKIIDWIFNKAPSVKEFCFLALPFATYSDGLYNAQTWNIYFITHNNPFQFLPTGLDEQSISLVKQLLNRRNTIRYFLPLTEIFSYYKAKRLSIPYWFPNNGTLLKSVFLYKAGTIYIPSSHKSKLANRLAIDGGAASGDSSLVLLECGASQVLAFEPSPIQRAEMDTVFKHNNVSDRIRIAPFALGEHYGSTSFNDQYGETFEAQTVSIDDYCLDENVGCIKLDIEGAEFPAIRGAAKTIERCHPILLICTYHRPEDLFEMPRWLQQRFPFYKFLLRDTEPGNRGAGVHLTLIAWDETV